MLRVYIRPRKQFRIWLGQHFRFGKRFNIRDINELYWYDKTKSITHSKSYGFLYPDENTITVASGKYTFRIPVSDDYSPEDAEADAAERKFEMDPVYGQSVTAAAENARAIYEAYEGLDNYERLWNYKNEIRNLSGYNRETSGVPYGNPWQMIWVFDGDPETKVVCVGFSKAFQYLNDLSSGSAEVITVQGTLVGAGNHMWNIVTMEDGNNYLADITNCKKGEMSSDEYLFLAGYQSGNVDEGYACAMGAGRQRYTYSSSTGFSDSELTLFPFSYLESGNLTPQADYSAELGIVGYDLVGRLTGLMAARASTVTVLRTAEIPPEEISDETPGEEAGGNGGETGSDGTTGEGETGGDVGGDGGEAGSEGTTGDGEGSAGEEVIVEEDEAGESGEIIEETIECQDGSFRIPLNAEGTWSFTLAVSLADGWTSEFGAETTIDVLPLEETIRIPEGTELIEDEAFRGVPARMIRIPDSVWWVGEQAFADNTELIFADSNYEVTADSAFDGCGQVVRTVLEWEYDYFFAEQIPFLGK